MGIQQDLQQITAQRDRLTSLLDSVTGDADLVPFITKLEDDTDDVLDRLGARDIAKLLIQWEAFKAQQP